LEWSGEKLIARCFPGGANLALSAPVDVLYAATEINEWAFAAARSQLDGSSCPLLEEEAGRLQKMIQEERNPALLRLRHAARENRVSFLSDDDQVSVGLGTGSITFPVDGIPDPDSMDWSEVHDIPVALVTGTNGKSTTVRLLAAMIRAAGKVPGLTSTDGIQVGEELVEAGDFSGPSGARALLRHRQVEMAALECARGGMLRRGLGVRRARTALVTNVGRDHLGEFGVADQASLVETKLVVRRALGYTGTLVLNAEDAALRSRGPELQLPIAWFTREPADEMVRRHWEGGGMAALVQDGCLVLCEEGKREPVIAVDEVPVTLEGAAEYNVANTLAALLVGSRLGLRRDAMAAGLRGFQGSPEENPGRGNLFEVAGVRMLVDFAHNPHAFHALFRMARRLKSKRVLVLLGQAGDRDDDSIRELVQATWEGRPDHVILKEMPRYLRGRQPGEVLEIMEAEFSKLGAPAGLLQRAPCDLLLLLAHEAREEVLKLLAALPSRGWRPGQNPEL
jgi:UDP-N-acetylmuramyl tripeptide synthase